MLHTLGVNSNVQSFANIAGTIFPATLIHGDLVCIVPANLRLTFNFLLNLKVNLKL